jgi:hypothetical protein
MIWQLCSDTADIIEQICHDERTLSSYTVRIATLRTNEPLKTLGGMLKMDGVFDKSGKRAPRAV